MRLESCMANVRYIVRVIYYHPIDMSIHESQSNPFINKVSQLGIISHGKLQDI